jgi:pilus assembly protein CpaE
MDVPVKDTMADILPRADRLDERMLTGAVAVHQSKVHVLAQPSDLERIEEVRADDLYAVINAAARGYQYVVVDVGIKLDEATLLALSVADFIVLVTTPDVIAVRDAYRRIKLFEANGIERDRLRLVVNRHHKAAFVKVEDIEQNLGLKVVATIADDPKTIDQAINEGKLVRMINKKSDAARDISGLVALLTEGGETTEASVAPAAPAAAGSKGFFASLFNRG